jgi:hypothetical protein
MIAVDTNVLVRLLTNDDLFNPRLRACYFNQSQS